jgi:hypothetical protein
VAVTGAIDIDDLVTEFEIQSQDNAKAIAKGRKWVADSVLEEHPQQAELVAYCYVRKNSSADALTFDPNPVNAVEGTVFPLYAHPPQQAAPVAWMYEHDGHMGPHIITQNRWPQCQEPWNETPLYTTPQQAKPVAIPGAVPMSEIAARSRSMPERTDALEAARERLKQAEPVADSGNPSF